MIDFKENIGELDFFYNNNIDLIIDLIQKWNSGNIIRYIQYCDQFN